MAAFMYAIGFIAARTEGAAPPIFLELGLSREKK